jgi:CRP-like cAMP-binding protein
MENLGRLLAEHPFLKDLDQGYLDLLVGCAANVLFQPGQLIFRQGNPADHFYLLRHGMAAVEIPTPERGAIRVQSVGEGEIFGWEWFVPPYQARYDVRALELTRALGFDGKCLREKFAQDRALGYEIIRRFVPILVKRLEATRLQLLDIYGNPAGRR